MSCWNSSKIGTWSWAYQEFFKGRLAFDKDSNSGGWAFNETKQDGHFVCDEQSSEGETPKCDQIPPAVANTIDSSVLVSKPFFSKNSEHIWLYSDQPVTIDQTVREKLLANEIPALTFAAGHSGVKEFNSDEVRNFDIRQRYLKDRTAEWPRGEPDTWEWRHNDLYMVAYPYLFSMYDEWVRKAKGDAK